MNKLRPVEDCSEKTSRRGGLLVEASGELVAPLLSGGLAAPLSSVSHTGLATCARVGIRQELGGRNQNGLNL